MLLADGFDYPEADAWLDQYVVLEAGKARVFRNWFTDYDAEGIRKVMENAGYAVAGLSNGLSMDPLTADTEWIGVRAMK